MYFFFYEIMLFINAMLAYKRNNKNLSYNNNNNILCFTPLKDTYLQTNLVKLEECVQRRSYR